MREVLIAVLLCGCVGGERVPLPESDAGARTFGLAWCGEEQIHCVSRITPEGPWNIDDENWAPTCEGHPYLEDFPGVAYPAPFCVLDGPAGEAGTRWRVACGITTDGARITGEGYEHCVRSD